MLEDASMHPLPRFRADARLSMLLALGAMLVAGDAARLAAGQPAQAPKLEIRRGDHISILGNALADRMQHDGWLESYFHSRFPKDDLVFRNLGFTGDEVEPGKRLRSANFGSPDKWLTFT